MKTLAKLLLTACLALPIYADDKPQQDVDWDKARQLYQREQNGDKLTADEQAYLTHAKEVRRAQNEAQNAPPGVDLQKARELMRRQNAGEKLTDDEQQYLENAKKAVAARQAANNGNNANRPNAANVPPPPAPRESTGLVPLTQLTGDATYKGQTGGLYGNGSNEPPAKLKSAALAAAAQIQPLNADGKPAPDGRIVLISMGMSNTTMEFSTFVQLANNDHDKSPKVQIVDCAQGGQDAPKWNTAAPGDHSPWPNAEQRLKSAGVTDAQVQVIWLKQAIAGQGRLGEFPKHGDQLTADVEQNIKLARERFPNLKLVYLSSRIYAGYATTPLNPEPYAYEGAFAMRNVILNQLKTDLPKDGAIILWGPYLWADGTKGRSQDDLVYTREDLVGDGTHPSASGRQKVAQLLLKHFKTDPTAKGWFCKN